MSRDRDSCTDDDLANQPTEVDTAPPRFGPGEKQRSGAAVPTTHPAVPTARRRGAPPATLSDTLETDDASSFADYDQLAPVDPAHYADRVALTQGGMGRIVSARDRRLGRRVALKELRDNRPSLRARFEREALLTARLEHPSIVSLHEAGRWPSGAPFYAMRLVSGRSLDRVIAETTNLEERLALLPHVLAVADALAYAHEQRVIHRDLKPHNIMIGEFGETVVIDWGLAKDLTVADDPAAAPDRSADASGAETGAGQILGTPAYMPPEQADGLSVDERADVYAIGAILYHLLTGEHPFSGGSSDEILEAVRSGPPRSVAERVAGIPADLHAVVGRAMARDPKERYPSARELADDLRRFQAGQLVGAHRYSLRQLVLRWLRRHRAAVAVGVAAAVALLVLGAVGVERVVSERRQAEMARARAEQHRTEAEELLDFMLFELKGELEPIGKLELLDAVARKASDYYAGRPEGSGAAERRRAAARVSLGEVLYASGDAAAALAEQRAALASRKQLVARDPDNVEWRRELAASHDHVGDALALLGRRAEALAEYRRALAVREALAARAPEDGDIRQDLAVSHSNLGNLLKWRGAAAESLAAYRQALAIMLELAARSPGDAERQRQLAVSHAEVGAGLSLAGDSAAALAEHRAALAIRERLTARHPDDARFAGDASRSHEEIGSLLRVQGDPRAALAAYRRSLAIRDQLVARDPTNALLQLDLAIVRGMIGTAHRDLGDARAALAEYRAAVALCERLVTRDPTNLSWQRTLASGHTFLGSAHQALGELDAAVAEYRTAAELFDALVARDPDNGDWKRELAVARSRAGEVLQDRGEPAAAIAEHRASLAIMNELAAADGANTMVRRDVAVGHYNIALALLAQDERAAARREYRAALAVMEELAARDPDNARWRREVAELQKEARTCCGP
jgi:tetratricopeptide (TPR) repeat protein